MISQYKIKIGDKIKIKSLQEFKRCRRRNFSGKMDKYAGTVMTITDIWSYDEFENCYKVHEDNGIFVWYENMIE